ncbi:putative Argonaute protein group [Hibiscus syriacus]|uniref:RING-type E3 ubiquitin transferase n=1 Tax=Hibiscus syriacus TaxID=106335 RepID=A0A6A3ANX3_HIBSY|nr:putative Argonaute protein group [Hibiscus syriacus]
MLNLGRWIFFFIVTVVVAAAQPEVSPRGESESYEFYPHFDPSINSMTIIVMVIVCVFFFVGFVYICIIHCNESIDISTAASAVESPRREGLDKAVIESFPVFEYSRVKDLETGKEAMECVVCLREFEDDETVRLMPRCSHVFHHDCINAWLAFHVTCPVCRVKLSPDSGVLNSNSNTESGAPTTEGNAYVVIQVNEVTQRGKFQRCHSTGHSVIQLGR